MTAPLVGNADLDHRGGGMEDNKITLTLATRIDLNTASIDSANYSTTEDVVATTGGAGIEVDFNDGAGAGIGAGGAPDLTPGNTGGKGVCAV